MPRLKPLTKDEQMDRELDALISYHAKLLGLEKDKDIAKALGMKADTYCDRKKLKNWSIPELRHLFRTLRFTPEEKARVF